MFPHPALRRRRYRIYQSPRHLLTTIAVVAAPFLFLLVFTRLAGLNPEKLLFEAFSSFWRITAAYGIAAFLGWALAVLFYRGRRALVALPVFDVLQSFPTSAALPVVALTWGVTSSTVIFFLMLEIIWPVFFSVVSSLKLIRRDWEEVSEISGLSGVTYFKKFLGPVSIPGLITGSVIGLGEAWQVLVATEIVVGVRDGLGNFFQAVSQNSVLTSFGILGLLFVIFSINKLLWLPLLEWSHRIMEE
jgi:ABC-type nitrate/sulfonate/bicarbonate transport system permease component